MAVHFEVGYSLPGGDEALINSRILHARNWLTGGTITASNTASDYFATGPDNSLTYEFWSPGTLNVETWEYDHGSAVECDACGVGAHNLFTAGSTLKVEYFDGSWQTLIDVTPTDDSPVYAIFEPVTAQRWRIEVDGTAMSPVIGAIRFGKSQQMPRPVSGPHRPLELGRRTEARTNLSETGEFLGRTIQRRYLETSIGWNILEDTWVNANWPNLQRALESEPFFLAWRPGDDPGVGYCYTDEVPDAQYTGEANYMAASMQVMGRSWE
ncbi:MAG: hypothetical protein AAFX90_10080 [Pseudomonadota bacterium]